MFWQNFQIPCVFPDRDFFGLFPCFPCAVGTLYKGVRTKQEVMRVDFVSGVWLVGPTWVRTESKASLLQTLTTLLNGSAGFVRDLIS